MSQPLDQALPFSDYLATRVPEAGLHAEEVVLHFLPLVRQVHELHTQGLVAPLEGVAELQVADGELFFARAAARSPRLNESEVQRLQPPLARRGLQVVAEYEVAPETETESERPRHLSLGRAGQPLTRPVYLPAWRAWEHELQHHDSVTDCFSLGLLLASLALGLDFTQDDELERFVDARDNLFALKPQLHPLLADLIRRLTELDRRQRHQDLPSLLAGLANYREQPPDLRTDLLRLTAGLAKTPGDPQAARRGAILNRLRDRLFELTRRNRLLYFRATRATLDLTEASVPLQLDPRNLRVQHLLTWNQALHDWAVAPDGKDKLSINRYLRLAEQPYLGDSLDEIRLATRRDLQEYGFAQLRLVLVFLRWHNLKEAPDERIHTPLLLLPVTLDKRAGVPAQWTLTPESTEAEVNPVLRQQLRQLYGVELPESLDLAAHGVRELYDKLAPALASACPGVQVQYLEAPAIALLHDHAQQRFERQQRRQRLSGAGVRSHATGVDYSFKPEYYQPLGLQLFLRHIRPARSSYHAEASAPGAALPPTLLDAPPTQPPGPREVSGHFKLRRGSGDNRYTWDFDLGAVTLGNFNYRKMSLVRDYTSILQGQLAHPPSDELFDPAPAKHGPPALAPMVPAEMHLVVACDPTQAGAIATARAGRSFIIQGPPGTGKSQTIANLIADYLARDQRVLFICEKRVALDVVYHRLARQGLGALCALIHDSQSDKKAFVKELQQTFTAFQEPLEPGVEAAREQATSELEGALEALAGISELMQRDAGGVPVRELLARLVDLGRPSLAGLPPAWLTRLPPYSDWQAHGAALSFLSERLVATGASPRLAEHPLALVNPDLAAAANPALALQQRLTRIDERLDTLSQTLGELELEPATWLGPGPLAALLDYARQVQPLAELGLLPVLTSGPVATDFDQRVAAWEAAGRAAAKANERTTHWRKKLSPDETRQALEQAQALAQCWYRVLLPSWWRLRGILLQCYDFTQHQLRPTWERLLSDLQAAHEADAALADSGAALRQEYGLSEIAATAGLIRRTRQALAQASPKIQALHTVFTPHAQGARLVGLMLTLAEPWQQLRELLEETLALPEEPESYDELRGDLQSLQGCQAQWPALLPALGALALAGPTWRWAARQLPLTPRELEATIALKTYETLRQSTPLAEATAGFVARLQQQLRLAWDRWLGLNADCLQRRARRRFQEHLRLTTVPLDQLSPDEREFRKTYAQGCKELEREFNKVMRFRSIRDLASDPEAGLVVRDLKPVWLMSPLSVADTIPLQGEAFDVVIFDEASQIKLEEALPAIHRAPQVIVVGDHQQLPPTNFFGSGSVPGDPEDDSEAAPVELDLDNDSLLKQAQGQLQNTMLGWHYRSRYESLISFSNQAFYGGGLLTVPERQPAPAGLGELRLAADETPGPALVAELARRPIAYLRLADSPYEQRRNLGEARVIAGLVRHWLSAEHNPSLGIVAFSEAQQGAIESALNVLAKDDPAFAARLEAEREREEDGQYLGLFVKNLENVQGDERDIILISVCYGPDASGRMLMNFGPINLTGGEKRLNVIFSRARRQVVVVSSIAAEAITNVANTGARHLRAYLAYASACSRGELAQAQSVLWELGRHAGQPAENAAPTTDGVVADLAQALRARGCEVATNLGQSQFRLELAVRRPGDPHYTLAIQVDTAAHYAQPELLDRYFLRPGVLRVFGWRTLQVLTRDWLDEPETVLARILAELGDSPPQPPTAPPILPKIARRGHPAGPTPASAELPGPAGAPGASAAPAPAKRPPAQPGPSTPAAAPTGPPKLQVYLENRELPPGKFWEATVRGPIYTVRFGRLGTAGQSRDKTFPSLADALMEAKAMIADKRRAGYSDPPPKS